jgi:DNA polymerase-3 subunit alpha
MNEGAHHEPPIIVRKRDKIEGNSKPQRFVSLHHHSTLALSYLDGYGLPAAHVRRVAELNMSGLAMTEHGNIDSHTQLERAALDTGVKPIFGCEVYMPAEPTLSQKTQSKFHLTVIARNAEGYRNLVALVTKSWLNFYHEPTVTWQMLVKRRRGLMILSGCQGSYLACATVGGKTIPDSEASVRRGIRVAKRFASMFGKWYVVEVQAFPELEKTRRFNKVAGQIARAAGVRLVASKDCHYTQFAESEMQKVLHGLRPGQKQTLEERERDWGYNVPLCPPASDNSIYHDLRRTGLSKGEAIQAIVSTEEIAQECNVTLPKLDMVRFPLPEGYDNAIDYWRDQLMEGWHFRGLNALPPHRRNAYRKQLVREMRIIESKDFVDYFLLTQAGVRYVKDKGHPVGPARGSAGASVCAWLLRITEVDPLRSDFNGLLRFERFIDITRTDMPDIDLDFPGSVRPLLRDFYINLLGSPDCVNNVGTFTYFRSKNSLDDVARVHNINRADIEQFKKYLVVTSDDTSIAATISSNNEARTLVEKHPEILHAVALEGNIRGYGVHAAGIILSNAPISEVTSTSQREVNGNLIQAIGLDKRDAKYRGLLKMDFLGLNNMQMLDDAVRHPDIPLKLKDLYAMPLDDPEVYAGFCEGDCTGIFQFDGPTTRNVCNGVQPTVFQELMDITSLSRPGPLVSGSTAEYIDIKHGRKKLEELHPVFTDITAKTRGQIIYQEQIMETLRRVGGFNPELVNTIRVIVSEKHGSAEFDKYYSEFLKGAMSIDMDPDTAELIWRRMITAGSYAFNAPHAAAYSQISYYTMWLKRHYPHVFFYAALKNLVDIRKELIRDGHMFGRSIAVKPPKFAIPLADDWRSGKDGVYAGLSQIPGIGPATVKAISDAQMDAKQPWRGWDDLITVKGIGPKTLKVIKDFASSDDPFGAYRVQRAVSEVVKALEDGELSDLPVPTHSGADIHENEGIEYPVVWLGAITEIKLRDWYEQAAKFGNPIDPASAQDPELHELAVCHCEDGTEPVTIKFDRYRWHKFRGQIDKYDKNADLILVEGKRSKYAAGRQINVNNIWVISL